MKTNKLLSKKLMSAGLVLGSAMFLGSCISDGPNHTGAEFLKEDGHILSRELDSLTLEYPVDSFFMESTEPSHLGDLYWLVGNKNQFSAESRFGYYIKPDVLDSAENLKISLRFQSFGETDDAVAAVLNSLDSLKFIVRAFSVDSATTEEDEEDIKEEVEALRLEKDLLARDYLVLWNSDSSLMENYPSGSGQIQPVEDTVNVPAPEAGKAFYTNHLMLPNIYKALKLKDSLNSDMGHWLYFEISLAPGQSDVGMFRLATYFANTDSSLQFTWPPKKGETAERVKFNEKIYFNYKGMSPAPRGISYRLSHPKYQKAPSILSGKAQGLHMIINRDNFMDALKDANPAFDFGKGNEKFNNNYFIPYSEISVPVESVFVEHDSRLVINLISQLDSVLDSENEDVYSDANAFARFELEESESFKLFIWNYRDKKILDSLTVKLKSDDKGHLLALFEYAKNEKQNDTLFLPDSGIVEYNHRYIDNLNVVRTQFSIHAGENGSYSFYYWTEKLATLEPNGEGGNTSYETNYDKFLNSDSENITLRNTYGMQRMLNLNYGSELGLFDFFLSPSEGAILEDGSVQKIDYSVLAEAPLKLNSEGKLVVNVKLYFYQLDP